MSALPILTAETAFVAARAAAHAVAVELGGNIVRVTAETDELDAWVGRWLVAIEGRTISGNVR